MDAISMWQPYASLLIIGAKGNETRGKRFNLFGRRIFIQATQKLPDTSKLPLGLLQIAENLLGPDWKTRVPLGAILGSVIFTARVSTTTNRHVQSDDEVLMGDWRPGRYGYRVGNIHRLQSPIPCSGKQAVPFRIPPGVEAKLEAAMPYLSIEGVPV